MDIAPVDLINVVALAKRVIGLAEFRQELAQYLIARMQAIAPNLAALVGEQVSVYLLHANHIGLRFAVYLLYEWE